MPKNVTRYDILISCPGDVSQEEIDITNRSIQKFNDLYSNTLNIVLQSKHWSRNAFAQSGDKPQALLNEQFVDDCDAAVAIMWTRFGTPTDKFGSGTEEEIENMLANKKQVFMYFSQKPVVPDKIDDTEYNKVKAFKEKYKDRGIYYTYSTNEELEALVFAHLSQYFLSEKRVTELKEERAPKLAIKSIDSKGKLSDTFNIFPFVLNVENDEDSYLQNIKLLFAEIASIKVIEIEKASNTNSFESLNSLALIGYQKVEIQKTTKELIQLVAEKLKIELLPDFFSLGTLKKNSWTSAIGTFELVGSTEEKRKYHLIYKLADIIGNFTKWLPVERGFQGFNCLRLALQNEGTEIDEDVQITLTFPKGVLLTTENFPTFDNAVKGYLLKECDMYEIFGINSTSSFMSYDQSVIKSSGRPVVSYNPPFPGTVPDYDDDYMEVLNDVFKYSIYEEEDGKRVLKLTFDYIKHHTAVAFPTVIFVSVGGIEIPYSISSKHSADVLSGIIQIR